MNQGPVADCMETDCCIVGGGPGGAVLALLLARQGIRVTLLEAHNDFDRDFRGDVLQPAALDVIGQIGLAERVLAVAMGRQSSDPSVQTGSDKASFPDISRLKPHTHS
jgi:2-polyprenyl-6-methoxyphenol hydroxylase-like FAD-dependent oxidoreductase